MLHPAPGLDHGHHDLLVASGPSSSDSAPVRQGRRSRIGATGRRRTGDHRRHGTRVTPPRRGGPDDRHADLAVRLRQRPLARPHAGDGRAGRARRVRRPVDAREQQARVLGLHRGGPRHVVAHAGDGRGRGVRPQPHGHGPGGVDARRRDRRALRRRARHPGARPRRAALLGRLRPSRPAHARVRRGGPGDLRRLPGRRQARVRRRLLLVLPAQPDVVAGADPARRPADLRRRGARVDVPHDRRDGRRHARPPAQHGRLPRRRGDPAGAGGRGRRGAARRLGGARVPRDDRGVRRRRGAGPPARGRADAARLLRLDARVRR